MRLVGKGELNGKEASRAYWAATLENSPTCRSMWRIWLHEQGMLVITYRNQRDVLAAEALRFGADGLVVDASAYHQP